MEEQDIIFDTLLAAGASGSTSPLVDFAEKAV